MWASRRDRIDLRRDSGINSAVVRFGHERWFYYYLTGVIAVSLIIYVTMRYEEALGGRRRRARHIFELTRYRLIGVIETVPSRVFQ